MKARTLGVILTGMLVLSACSTPEPSSPSIGSMPTLPAAPKATNSLESLVLAKPQWRVGDEWRYSDGYAVRVAEAKDALTKFERLDVPGEWFINNGFFRQTSQQEGTTRQVVFRSENPDAVFYKAPLGQPMVYIEEYLRDKELVRHQTSWVIENRERITVPAGTFDTFVIVMRKRSLTSDWTAYERWWYAPATKNYVRMEYRYGDTPEGSRVLMSAIVGS